MKTQSDICAERYGFTNPTTMKVKCPCEGCIGYVKLEGLNIHGSLGFLTCGECGCGHCIEIAEGSAVGALAKAQ